MSKGKGIGMTFSIGDLQDVNIRDEDIVILLGNLLENAIHECEKVVKNGKEANIYIKFVQNEETFIFTVRNPILRKVVIEDNKVLEKNDDGHGIGLKNVEEVVKRYHGSFEISCDEKEFMAVVIL